MVFWNLLLFAVSFVVTALLAPKPKIENARASTLDDLKFPQASEGSPTPICLGKVRLRAPNTLWVGAFRAEAVTEKGPRKYGFFGPRKSYIVGYKYYISLDLGLCLGPDIVLRKIWMDKEVLWEGTAGPNETTFSVSKPDLFGGDKQGGGFAGTFTFYGGQFSQPANAYITGVIGDVYPAYIGTSHIVMQECYIGTTASLRPISFEVERYTNNLGLTVEQRLLGEDLNCAEVLYTTMVTKWGMLGLPTADINIPSIQAAAVVLAAENNGMSLLVSNANTGKDVVSEALRQMDGLLYQDPETGSISLKLIRQDYDVLTIPEFGPSDIVAIRGFTRTSWQDTINQVRVQYTNREGKYETGSAMEQDLANINMQGRVRSTNISFPGAYTGELAAQLAAREIAQLSVPLYSASFELKRRAGSLKPGDPFKLTWPDYGIDQVVMRVGKFNLGELLDGRIVIDATQDEFATSISVFAAPEPTGWEPISRTAIEIADYKVLEAPYFIVSNIDTTIGDPPEPGEGYFFNLAQIPGANQLGFSTRVTQATSFSGYVQGLSQESYSRVATLGAAIDLEDGFLTGTITSLSITGMTDITIPGLLTTVSETEARAGYNLFVLGNEIFTFQTATPGGTPGSYTLGTVRRALLDTDFESHAIGDTLFFIDTLEHLVPGAFKATASDPLSVAFSSFTDRDSFSWDLAPVFPLTPNQRFERPLPPDNLTINGVRDIRTLLTTTNYAVAWARRNRLSTDIRWNGDVDQTTEAGVTYELRVYLNGVLQPSYTQTGLTGTSATVNFVGGTVGWMEIRLRAVRGGLNSYTDTSVYFILGTPLVGDRPASWNGLLGIIIP